MASGLNTLSQLSPKKSYVKVTKNINITVIKKIRKEPLEKIKTKLLT